MDNKWSEIKKGIRNPNAENTNYDETWLENGGYDKLEKMSQEEFDAFLSQLPEEKIEQLRQAYNSYADKRQLSTDVKSGSLDTEEKPEEEPKDTGKTTKYDMAWLNNGGKEILDNMSSEEMNKWFSELSPSDKTDLLNTFKDYKSAMDGTHDKNADGKVAEIIDLPKEDENEKEIITRPTTEVVPDKVTEDLSVASDMQQTQKENAPIDTSEKIDDTQTEGNETQTTTENVEETPEEETKDTVGENTETESTGVENTETEDNKPKETEVNAENSVEKKSSQYEHYPAWLKLLEMGVDTVEKGVGTVGDINEKTKSGYDIREDLKEVPHFNYTSLFR